MSGVDPVSQSKAVSVRPTGLDDLYVLSRESDEMPTTQNSATAKRWVREAFPARRAISVDELGMLVGLRVGECLAVLASLAARGQVEPLGDGRWRLARRTA